MVKYNWITMKTEHAIGCKWTRIGCRPRRRALLWVNSFRYLFTIRMYVGTHSLGYTHTHTKSHTHAYIRAYDCESRLFYVQYLLRTVVIVFIYCAYDLFRVYHRHELIKILGSELFFLAGFFFQFVRWREILHGNHLRKIYMPQTSDTLVLNEMK